MWRCLDNGRFIREGLTEFANHLQRLQAVMLRYQQHIHIHTRLASGISNVIKDQSCKDVTASLTSCTEVIRKLCVVRHCSIVEILFVPTKAKRVLVVN